LIQSFSYPDGYLVIAPINEKLKKFVVKQHQDHENKPAFENDLAQVNRRLYIPIESGIDEWAICNVIANFAS